MNGAYAFGVGPDTAAALVTLIGEAAFAALCGVNPIPGKEDQVLDTS